MHQLSNGDWIDMTTVIRIHADRAGVFAILSDGDTVPVGHPSTWHETEVLRDAFALKVYNAKQTVTDLGFQPFQPIHAEPVADVSKTTLCEVCAKPATIFVQHECRHYCDACCPPEFKRAPKPEPDETWMDRERLFP
jgi:hypothetical protein